MSYLEKYQSAVDRGTLEPLTTDIKSWKEPGEQIVGVINAVKPFEGGKFENTCNQYILDTDSGLVSTVLGSSVDKQLEGKILINKCVVITYNGKVELDGGKQCNKFDIKVIRGVVEDSI